MMKIQILCLASVLFPLGVNAQYSEDFESVPVTNNHGYLPGGWTTYNIDGNTPAQNVNFIDSAWVVYQESNGNQLAISTSWYTPPGQSNDWMVSPLITVPTSNPYLVFDVMAPNDNAADDYEIYISTTGNTPGDFSTLLASDTLPPAYFTTTAANLSAYAGQQVYIAFRNPSNDETVLFIDNIKVIDLTMPGNNVAITGLRLNNYGLVNTDNDLYVEVKNVGGNIIDSLQMVWSDGANYYTDTIYNLNLIPYESVYILHNTPVNYSSVVSEYLTIYILNVNGGSDPNTQFNYRYTSFHTVNQIAEKKVVFEEGTGTWCGWCPRGMVAMEYMNSHPQQYPNFIGIAVHNNDPMVAPLYDSLANFYSFPNVDVDRLYKNEHVSTGDFIQLYNEREDDIPPAGIEISASYNIATREITTQVTANFHTRYTSANYRLGVIVVEDNVTGTDSTYAQRNYYAGGSEGPMGGFENQPPLIPASQMVYNHVGRALLGGYYGQPGSVPSVILEGDSPSYTFTYTLPPSYDEQQIHLVGVLLNDFSGVIINANKMELSDAIGIENPTTIQQMQVFPNPTSNFVNVTFSLKKTSNVLMSIYTISGKLVRTENYQHLTGTQNLQINVSNMAAGQYLISFATENGAVVKQLIVQ